ncbi:hypothetical protein F3Y22_tig00110430pilonHSYRG00152 [Hibiscus syriacus]|uniref:Myosin motor domain-containing protein n=1 Tax=Hibiscus syriacus TaxID=106335 RepID=A0A6A3AK81_HIBSY|nr:hypothetical protein F3Y22_tig00110430pilonHSYRG00152 [Hibiscus syriacus]
MAAYSVFSAIQQQIEDLSKLVKQDQYLETMITMNKGRLEHILRNLTGRTDDQEPLSPKTEQIHKEKKMGQRSLGESKPLFFTPKKILTVAIDETYDVSQVFDKMSARVDHVVFPSITSSMKVDSRLQQKQTTKYDKAVMRVELNFEQRHQLQNQMKITDVLRKRITPCYDTGWRVDHYQLGNIGDANVKAKNGKELMADSETRLVQKTINACFYQHCLNLQPNHSQAFTNLGNIYMEWNMVVVASYYKATLAVTTFCQVPDKYEEDVVLHQLRYCGVLKEVRISKSGYPTRMTHQKFVEMYWFLLSETNTPHDPLSISVALLKQFNVLPEIHRARCLFLEHNKGAKNIQSLVCGESIRRKYAIEANRCSAFASQLLDEQLTSVVNLQSVIRWWLVRRDFDNNHNSKQLNHISIKSKRRTGRKLFEAKVFPTVDMETPHEQHIQVVPSVMAEL